MRKILADTGALLVEAAAPGGGGGALGGGIQHLNYHIEPGTFREVNEAVAEACGGRSAVEVVQLAVQGDAKAAPKAVADQPRDTRPPWKCDDPLRDAHTTTAAEQNAGSTTATRSGIDDAQDRRQRPGDDRLGEEGAEEVPGGKANKKKGGKANKKSKAAKRREREEAQEREQRREELKKREKEREEKRKARAHQQGEEAPPDAAPPQEEVSWSGRGREIAEGRMMRPMGLFPVHACLTSYHRSKIDCPVHLHREGRSSPATPARFRSRPWRPIASTLKLTGTATTSNSRCRATPLSVRPSLML